LTQTTTESRTKSMTTMTTMESLIPSKTELGLIENLVVTPFMLNGWPSLRGVSSPGALFLFDILLIRVILSATIIHCFHIQFLGQQTV
jgi:hypothetical protein